MMDYMNADEIVLRGLQNHTDFLVVQELAKLFHEKGFELSLVGGCVRDFLLGLQPKDLDLVSNAKPEEILLFYPEALEVGRKFGVLKLKHPGLSGRTLEVATYREEDSYFDGRRPERILWSTREKDALRRDFTINAMSFDLHLCKIFDFVKGQADLNSRSLRAIGNPEKRFLEDHLRILRALRFAVHLDFGIEYETLSALRKTKEHIRDLSHERITEEIQKALRLKPLEIIKVYEREGIWQILLPQFSAPLKLDRLGKLVSWRDFLLFLLGQSSQVDQFQMNGAESDLFLKNTFPYFLLSREEKKFCQRFLILRRMLTSSDFTPERFFLQGMKFNFDPPLDSLNGEINSSIQVNFRKFQFFLQSSGWSDRHFPKPLITGAELVERGFSGAQIQKLLDEDLLLQLRGDVKTLEDLNAKLFSKIQKNESS